MLPPASLAFALLAALLFAALDLAQKWTARYAVDSPRTFLALRLLGGALLSPVLLLLPRSGTLTPAPADWRALASLVALNLLGNVLYLSSVYRADISVVGSLWPLKNVYLPFITYVTRRERFGGSVYALTLLASAGALAVAYNKSLRFRAFAAPPVLLMLLATVPVFAVSDILFGAASAKIGAKETTVLVSEGIALVGLPVLLLDRATRRAFFAALSTRHGILGMNLTGLFLVAGVACIGEAFARAGGAVVLVNVFAMLSGLVLLAVNAALPGRLDGAEGRGTYWVRGAGAAVLVAAAGLLLLRQ